MSTQIRIAVPNDIQFLKEMLFEAAYWRGNEHRDLIEALSTPELSKLLSNWGRKGDTAFIAEENAIPIGAAWYRFWNDNYHSYGYISEHIPELAVAIKREHRGKGIGRQLLKHLIQEAANAGHNQISLSVEQDNRAVNLYQNLGFKSVGTLGNSYTMVIHTLSA